MDIISSRDNSIIKQYAKLCSSKIERVKTGLFTIEGIKLCCEAQKEGVAITRLFVTANAYGKYTEEIEGFIASGVTANIITPDVENKMADTKTPQGIFAICKKLDNPLEMVTIYNRGLYVACCNIQDPANLGSMIRTAEAVGIDGLILTSDCCDIYSPKLVRATMGSLFRAKILITDDITGLTSNLNQNGVETYAAVVDPEAMSIVAVTPKSSAVIFIGNEGNGINDTQINACSHKVTVKMRGRTESLNAGAAAAIMMFEFCNKRSS